MDADRLIACFRTRLYNDEPGSGLFNPYLSLDSGWDRDHAVAIRRRNLEAYVRQRTAAPRILLLAEAPGPWGCRFSGVPITSEAQLLDPDFPLQGEQSSNAAVPHAEYSASIYWRILKPWYTDIFTWNTIPFHPFKPGKTMSIRTPRVAEIRRFLPVTQEVIDAVAPECVLAVGRKAERALAELDVECTYVRHPSQGGAALFEAGVREVLET